MPYTTNVSGTTITAAYGNANIRDQVVTPFATVAARDSAITSPAVGMVCYTIDTNTLWVYRGTAWRQIAGQKIYAMQNQTLSQYGGNIVGNRTGFYTSPDMTLVASHAYIIDYKFIILSNVLTVPTEMYTTLDVSTNSGSSWTPLCRAPWTHMGAQSAEWGSAMRYIYLPGATTTTRFRLDANLSDTTHGFDYGSNLAASHFIVESTGLLSSEVATS